MKRYGAGARSTACILWSFARNGLHPRRCVKRLRFARLFAMGFLMRHLRCKTFGCTGADFD